MNLVFGDKALAKHLGVCLRTIQNMKAKGKLDGARYKRGIRGNAYDLDKVMELLKY